MQPFNVYVDSHLSPKSALQKQQMCGEVLFLNHSASNALWQLIPSLEIIRAE